MHNSKLFKLLQTFQNNEWKACQRFIASQVKDDAEILQLYNYILRYKNNLKHKKLDQEYVIDELFPRKASKNFQNLLSKLYTYAIDYLAVKTLLEDDKQKELNIFRSLKERHLFYEANDVRLKAIEKITVSPKDLWNTYYLHLFNHHYEYLLNPLTKESQEERVNSELRA